MLEKRNSLNKVERIRKSREFKEVFRRGKIINGKYFRVYWLNRCPETVNCPYKRIGFVVSRKAGKAVQRNTLKRLIREKFRINKEKLPEGIDIVFLAKSGSGLIERKKINEEINSILNKINYE